MLNAEQLRTLIIEPALKDLNLQSDDATELLLFTCATESEGGTYLHQLKGPHLASIKWNRLHIMTSGKTSSWVKRC